MKIIFKSFSFLLSPLVELLEYFILTIDVYACRIRYYNILFFFHFFLLLIIQKLFFICQFSLCEKLFYFFHFIYLTKRRNRCFKVQVFLNETACIFMRFESTFGQYTTFFISKYPKNYFYCEDSFPKAYFPLCF